MLNNCLTRNLAAFVDWTTGKCTFDSEAFQQLLAFCNSFPDDSSSDDGIALFFGGGHRRYHGRSCLGIRRDPHSERQAAHGHDELLQL
ncbi:MAG: hypothetical protein ACLU3I_04610 [Acutalibacteraceae bacterium]